MSSETDSLRRMTTEELRRALAEQFETVRQKYDAVLELVAELVNQGAGDDGRTPQQVLIDDVRLSRGEAQRMVDRAEALHGTTSISGAPRSAALPENRGSGG